MRLLTLKTVLVATDLDETSGGAMFTAARLAALTGAALHVLHAADSPVEDGENRVMEYFRAAAPAAVEPESVLIRLGPPAALIVEQAVQLDADVIVLGPHRGQVRGGGLGAQPEG